MPGNELRSLEIQPSVHRRKGRAANQVPLNAGQEHRHAHYDALVEKHHGVDEFVAVHLVHLEMRNPRFVAEEDY